MFFRLHEPVVMSGNIQTRLDKCAAANRCYASPLDAGRPFGCALHAPPCSPEAAAELGVVGIDDVSGIQRQSWPIGEGS